MLHVPTPAPTSGAAPFDAEVAAGTRRSLEGRDLAHWKRIVVTLVQALVDIDGRLSKTTQKGEELDGVQYDFG